jgi:hypothetical protein
MHWSHWVYYQVWYNKHNMKKKGIAVASILTALAAALALLVVLLPKLQVADESVGRGSVTFGNEYFSTTSSAWLTRANPITLKSAGGALGQVVVLGTPTGFTHNFYNATTSDVNKRTGNKATSTILLTSIPLTATVGTYTFDLVFSDGLLLETVGTAAGTTTIMWR